jgi:signal transduction histidine kinase
MMDPPLQRARLVIHLALVAAAAALALLITWLGMDPQARDLVLLAVLMGVSGVAATVFGHLAVALAPRLRFASLPMRIGAVTALGSMLALAAILIVALLMFISRHDLTLLLALLVFSLAVALPLALVTASSLARSIAELGRGASAMAEGDLSVRVPVRGSDEFARLAATFNDMAARLGAAQQRQTELEEARRSLVAAVSHDLRTPLASLRAAAEALSDGVVSDPPTVRRYLGSIRAEAERLGALIDDLFELSLLDTGELQLEMEPTSLADLVSDTVESMRHQAEQKGVQLSGRAQSGMMPVLADPLKIQRVILNLVQNAIRHTPGEGTVRLEVCEEKNAATVSVADTCGGIRPEEMDQLFEPFYRGDPSRPRDGSGAGLGLSIAKGIVEAHGGRLWVENSAHHGCRFSFTLPTTA